MRNFMEAYAAVHNTEAKEELTSSRDCISEMNLSDLTDTDLDEIVEQVLEVMFSQGHTVDSAHEVFSEAFEESSITGRQKKIDRLCEALNRTFGVIDSKASTVALEEFAKYRNNKKLQESWSARFNQERRIQRAHDRLVAAESLNVKTQLLKLVEGTMGTMKIKGFEIPEKEQKAAADRVKEKTAQKMMKKEEVSQIRKSWGDAYRSIYADKETISEKGMNPGFKAYLEKQKAKKGEGGDEGKSSKGGGKPDFLDLDKDGDKKEPMKKASKEMKKEEVEQVHENRAAARAAGGYKDDSKKQTDPSKAGFTGISGSIKDIMRQNKEIEAKNKMKKEEVEQVDEGIADRARKAVGHQRQGTHGDDHEMDNMKKAAEKTVKTMNDRMGADAAAKRSEMDVKRRFPKNEGVEFSEAELKAFEAIVNSWED